MKFSKLQHKKGLTVWFHHRSPFTMAANICGMERFGRWMYRNQGLCDHLIEMALEQEKNKGWFHPVSWMRLACLHTS